MNLSLRKTLAATAVVGIAAVAVPFAFGGTASAVGPNIYAIDNANRIVTLTSNLNNNNATIVEAHDISGLVFAGETIVGLDRNVEDGLLYAVGTSEGGTVVYTIDPTTGEADALALASVAGDDETPIILEGSDFAVDVAPDGFAVSVISDTGQSVGIALELVDVDGVFLNPGDSVVFPNTSVLGLTGSAIAPNQEDVDLEDLTMFTTSRNRLYTTDPFTGVTTFVANLQSASTNGFDSGLDVVSSGDSDTAYYSRTISTASSLNSSVYTLDLETGGTTRLLTTPNGVTLREIAL